VLLITGSGGLLGANLLFFARGRGLDSVGVYYRHGFQLPGTRLVQVDLTDRSAVDEVVGKVRPSWIIHCAGLTNVDACEENPELARRSNSDATRYLAAAARRVGSRMLAVSTDAVFDGKRGLYSEEDRPAPVNVYAETKLQGEQAATDELENALIVRTNIYGWNLQDKRSLADWMLHLMEAGTVVPGFTDVFFSPILVNDLAEVFLEMIDKRLSGIYHVAGSEASSKFNFARRVAETFGLSTALVRRTSVDESGLRAPRPKNVSLVTVKIAAALGRSMPDISSGLAGFKELRDSGYAARLRALGGG
jgi:dTDP-4-dehydrorhamnose reductase